MGAGGVALLGMELGLTYSGANQDVVYGTSLAMAVVWAGIGATVAIIYCRWALQRENAWFASQTATSTADVESVKASSLSNKQSGSTSQIPILVQDG